MNFIYFVDYINSIKKIKSKSDLRHIVLNFRDSLNKNDVTFMSKKIYKKFLSTDIIKKSSKFMLYCDFRNEVKTREIIETLLNSGKEVYLPITIKDEKKLIPKRIFSFEDLKPGTYGILEPKENSLSIDSSLLDIIVVPGVAFDKSGYRIGYGGGYYDRFLENIPALKIGICFDFQLVDNVFPEKYDKKMDFLITDKNFLKF